MFHRLQIQNFGLIKELALDFTPGLIAFTGETGAGKSMILDAIHGALGHKASDKGAEAGLKDGLIELAASEKGVPLIFRYACQKGKRSYWVNGQKTKVTVFREKAEPLAALHGQHSHLQYLKPQRQRDLLDAFAQNGNLQMACRQAYETWCEKNKFLANCLAEQQKQAAWIEHGQYMVASLSAIAPQVGEWERLSLQQKAIAREQERAALQEGLHQFLNSEGVGDRALLSELHHWQQRAVQEAKYAPEFQLVSELLENAAVALSELERFLAHGGSDTDPVSAAACERRLRELYDEARKWKVLPEHLPDLWQETQEKLALAASCDQQVDLAAAACDAAASIYQQAADRLSESRLGASDRFRQSVESAIADLGMQGARFELSWERKAAFAPEGQDQLVFCMSTIPGFPPAPMDEVVSGGELSRLALVFETLCASPDQETWIFDEPDVGIGGQTAHLIGRLLHRLSQHKQVIVVTHLPQIAARADLHFALAKKPKPDADGLFLEVTCLTDPDMRVKEIARMLGGMDRVSVAHAEALLAAPLE